MLVQPFSAATVCEFEPVPENGPCHATLAQTMDTEKAKEFAICP